MQSSGSRDPKYFQEHASAAECGKCRANKQVRSGLPVLLGQAAERQVSAVAWGIDFFRWQALEGSPRASVQLQEVGGLGPNHAMRRPSAKLPIRRRITQGSEDRESMKKKGSVDRGVPEAGKGLPADALAAPHTDVFLV
jgi:hypothetical protein